jgi:hypothetical protein
LIILIENCNVDNLYSKPKCHVVSKAFSISKNTAGVDVLLLKFHVYGLAGVIALWPFGTDHVENTVSSSSSIAACGLIVVGTCFFLHATTIKSGYWRNKTWILMNYLQNRFQWEAFMLLAVNVCKNREFLNVH